MKKLMLSAALAASLGVTAAPGAAGAYPHHYYHHAYYHHAYYHHRGCQAERHRSGAIGAVAGAIGGGIIGSRMTHGGGGGTLLGAGAGALTGNALARSTVHC
jgi:hypothetical protein